MMSLHKDIKTQFYNNDDFYNITMQQGLKKMQFFSKISNQTPTRNESTIEEGSFSHCSEINHSNGLSSE